MRVISLANVRASTRPTRQPLPQKTRRPPSLRSREQKNNMYPLHQVRLPTPSQKKKKKQRCIQLTSAFFPFARTIFEASLWRYASWQRTPPLTEYLPDAGMCHHKCSPRGQHTTTPGDYVLPLLPPPRLSLPNPSESLTEPSAPAS